MSQSINLLLEDLKPKADWLALPVVASVSTALLVLTVSWGIYATMEAKRLSLEKAQSEQSLKGLQQQVTTLSKEVANRKPNPQLELQITDMQASIDRRQEALALVRKGQDKAQTGFSVFLAGLSRQVSAGVWLTGFAIREEGDLEISGRLIDPSLLPGYIRKLNNETAFQGRRFAALDMKGVRQQQASGSSSPAQPVSPQLAALAGLSTTNPASASSKESGPMKYIEFTLRGKLPAAENKTGDAQ